MLEEQNGVCCICYEKPTIRALDVDHNHATGVIRGLLCSRCNTTLGKVNDSTVLLQKLINYLEVKK